MFLEHEPQSRPATHPRRSSTRASGTGLARCPPPTPFGPLPTGTVQPAQPATLEHFLAERYFLYALRKNQLYQGQVHHTPYPLQTADLLSLDESLLAACGLHRPSISPIAHFATGVNVEVFPLQRV